MPLSKLDELEVAKLKGEILEMVDSLKRELKRELDRDLLFDARGLPDGSMQCIKIQDKPHQNSISNYRFLPDERNPFGKERTIAME